MDSLNIASLFQNVTLQNHINSKLRKFEFVNFMAPNRALNNAINKNILFHYVCAHSCVAGNYYLIKAQFHTLLDYAQAAQL